MLLNYWYCISLSFDPGGNLARSCRKKLHHFNWTHTPPPSLSSKWNISQLERTKKSKESSTRISHLHTNIAMWVLCLRPKPSMAVKTKDCSCLNCLILVTGFPFFFPGRQTDNIKNLTVAWIVYLWHLQQLFYCHQLFNFPISTNETMGKILPHTQHKLLNLSSRSLVR